MTIKSRLTSTLVTVILFAALLGAGSLLVQDRLAAGISNLEKQSKKIALVADLQLATEKLLMPANDCLVPRDIRVHG